MDVNTAHWLFKVRRFSLHRAVRVLDFAFFVSVATVVVTGLVLPNVSNLAKAQSASQTGRFAIPYRLNDPDAIFELPHRLDEISGLATGPDGNLAAIQDEEGRLFLIQPTNGRVINEYRFGKGGDYEGVEFLNGYFFVLRSDGTLFRISMIEGKSKTSKISTWLSSRCDAEGLVSDPILERLLIVCKEGARGQSHSVRAVYSFNFRDEIVGRVPAMLLSREDITTSLQAKRSEFDHFKPSAIAIHPRTGNVYIVSSVDRELVVITRGGIILGHHRFSKKLTRQPEGLTFGDDGSLYVSSEGAGHRGRILRFLPVGQEDASDLEHR